MRVWLFFSIAMQTIQTLAARALIEVLSGKNLNEIFAATLARSSQLAAGERAALRDLCFGTLRHYGQVRATLNLLVTRPLTDPFVDKLLSVAIYQLLHTRAAQHAIVDQAVKAASEHQQGRLKGLVNGVLRSFLRQQDSLAQQITKDTVGFWNHPEWWIAEVRQAYPGQWKAILKAGNDHPPMTLRVNARHGTPEQYLARLAEQDMAADLIGESAIRLVQAVPVDKLPGFADGDVSVQDAGAQLAAEWLDVQAGMRVLDACAAPGGKTGHLLEKYADLNLLALDSDRKRLGRVEDNLRRLDLHATLKQGDAGQPEKWWDGQLFDRILADVPCSASGVARRQPDIKWTRRSTDIRQFAQQQAAIVDALWPLLAQGGKLLYVTCSLFPAENNRQIEAFLSRHADAVLERETQLIPDAEHDGFYYARLAKS